MKVEEVETALEPLEKAPTITDKIKKLRDSCQFDLIGFYNDNKGLVKKYLRKNTYKIKIEDFENVPDHWWYKQNEGLLRANIKNKEFTTKQKLEWIKCGLNVVYFTKKYIKIISVDEGVIPFNLYDYQEELIHKYEDNRFVISMQCRQSGKCVVGDTNIRNKFLGKETNSTISSIFKVSNILDQCKLSNKGFINVEEQIFKDLLQIDREEESGYSGIWRSSSYNTRKLWWDELIIQSGKIDPERTSQGKKFISSSNVRGLIKVYTDKGWKDVNEIHKTIPYEVWDVKTDNYILRCADNHILFKQNEKEVFTKELSVGDKIITESGIEEVTSISKSNDIEYMYDLGVNSKDHRYFTNGLLSHNTQTTSAFLTHFVIFNAAKDVGVLAQLTGQAQEILERIQMSYEQLPLFIQPGVRMYNKRSFSLHNKSKAVSYSSTSTSVRGKTFALVYIDECAFLKNDMAFYESTYPTISSGKTTRVIITSTPNGMRGLFYKLWTEAVGGLNSYVTIEVPWYLVPGRDEAWKKETIANTSEEQFRQEQDLVFRGSENSLITGRVLETLVKKTPIEASEEGLKVYIEPIKRDLERKGDEDGHEYLLVVDVSRGLGLDYHAFTIIDISTSPHEVVCTFRNNTLSSMLYPSLIMNAAMRYNNAHVLVELNDIGEQVANDLYYELEYENMLCVVSEKGRQTIGFVSDKMKLGVRTSKAVKAVGCSNAKTFIEKGKINLNDENLIDEFGTFVPRGASYAADDGANDDGAMTIVLYSWAMVQPYFVDLTNQDARRRLLEQARKEKEEDIMPFGFIESNEFGSFSEDSMNNFYNF